MKQYNVKPEYIDKWIDHSESADSLTVSDDEISRLSIEWGVDMFDLLAQVDINEKYMSAAVELMDDEIREDIHMRGLCKNDAQFLREYEIRHLAKYGEPFYVI